MFAVESQTEHNKEMGGREGKKKDKKGGEEDIDALLAEFGVDAAAAAGLDLLTPSARRSCEPGLQISIFFFC